MEIPRKLHNYRIVFNSQRPKAAASHLYRECLSLLDGVSVGDFSDYAKYEVAIFMGYDGDLAEAKRSKISNPKLLVGIADPRGELIRPFLEWIDFLLVDSLEMLDFHRRFGLPILQYSEYPCLEPIRKVHSDRGPLIIGYHGNQLHLISMFPNLTRALEIAAAKFKCELWAVYNVGQLGRWSTGVPKGIPVRHIQWYPEVYQNELASCDIGIVPALMPIRNIGQIKKKAASITRFFNESDEDYLLRFKMLSNPGRIITFGLLGIPVIADMFPSALQLIQHGENGYVAYSCAGWRECLGDLLSDSLKRNTFSEKMQETILKNFSTNHQNQRLLNFVSSLSQGLIPCSAAVKELTKSVYQLGSFKKDALSSTFGKLISLFYSLNKKKQRRRW